MSDTPWKVIFVPEAEKEFFKLDHEVQRQIQQYFRKKITTSLNPRRFGRESFWYLALSRWRLSTSLFH